MAAVATCWKAGEALQGNTGVGNSVCSFLQATASRKKANQHWPRRLLTQGRINRLDVASSVASSASTSSSWYTSRWVSVTLPVGLALSCHYSDRAAPTHPVGYNTAA